MVQVLTRRGIRVSVDPRKKLILVRAPFECKDTLKAIPGATWVKSLAAWTYPMSPLSAERIRSALGNLLEYEINGDEAFGRLEASAVHIEKASYRKTDEDIPQPPIHNLPAWKHQARGFWFAHDIFKAGGGGVMLAMDMGEQPLDAKVLTPNGWRRIGELRLSDQVIGVDGQPTRVIEIHDFESRLLWRVRFNDGAEVHCSPTHLWTVKSSNRRWQVVPLALIRETLNNPKRWERLDKIPLLSPVEFDEKELPLDPYVMGILLSEGSLTNGRIKFTASKPSIVEEVRRRGFSVTTETDGVHHIITGLSPTVLLKKLGLSGKGASEKNIPAIYLWGSVRQRKDLLHGLMDGDGTHSGRCVYFSTTSERLANDISYLARSLGGGGSLWSPSRKTVTGKREWRVSLSLPIWMDPFGVSGKFKKRTREMLRRIVSIHETSQSVPMRCIRVSNPDGLYVTDDFIVTHNTGKSRTTIDILQNTEGMKKAVILCPLSVVSVWPTEFRKHSAIPFKVVKLSEDWGVSRKADVMADYLDAQARLPLVFICNYESAWREPLASLMLSQSWDYAICDESHRIKSTDRTARASKFCEALSKVSIRRLALTGTPLPHSPMDAFSQYRFLDPSIFGSYFSGFRAKFAIMGGFGGKEIIGYKNEPEFNRLFYSIAYRVGKEVLDLPPAVHLARTCTLEPSAMNVYQKIERQFYAELEAGEITASNALTKLLRLQQVAGGSVKADDGSMIEISRAKRRLLKDVLEDLDEGEPVVVFCRFRSDLEAVHAVARELKRGSMELSGAVHQLEEWQKGGAPILAVQIQAGGVGISLVRARYCIYFSKGFNLGDYEQSLARVHRPGQGQSVTYIHLITAGTVDERVEKALRERKEVVEAILTEMKTKEDEDDGGE